MTTPALIVSLGLFVYFAKSFRMNSAVSRIKSHGPTRKRSSPPEKIVYIELFLSARFSTQPEKKRSNIRLIVEIRETESLGFNPNITVSPRLSTSILRKPRSLSPSARFAKHSKVAIALPCPRQISQLSAWGMVLAIYLNVAG